MVHLHANKTARHELRDVPEALRLSENDDAKVVGWESGAARPRVGSNVASLRSGAEANIAYRCEWIEGNGSRCEEEARPTSRWCEKHLKAVFRR